MPRLVKAGETVASRRRVYFDLRQADGITPATGEDGGQPQISIDNAAFTNTGIGTLHHIGNGRCSADLTTGAVAVAGSAIETRYKSSNTAECPGDSVQVVAFDPNDAAALGLTNLDLAASAIRTDLRAGFGAIADEATAAPGWFPAGWDGTTDALNAGVEFTAQQADNLVFLVDCGGGVANKTINDIGTATVAGGVQILANGIPPNAFQAGALAAIATAVMSDTTDPDGAAIAGIATTAAAIKAQTDKLSFAGSAVHAVADNMLTDYQQRGVAVTLPSTPPAGYGTGTGLGFAVQASPAPTATLLNLGGVPAATAVSGWVGRKAYCVESNTEAAITGASLATNVATLSLQTPGLTVSAGNTVIVLP